MASVSAIWGDLKELGRIFEGFLEGFWRIYGVFRKGFKKEEKIIKLAIRIFRNFFYRQSYQSLRCCMIASEEKSS